MTDLTEQLKKGELPRGWYYVLLFSNEEYIAFIDGKWVVDDRLVESDITEVLAPVPTYQQLQRLKDENQQLRQLLKECRDFLDNLYYPVVYNDYETNITNNLMRELLTRINAVIGESEEK